MKQEYESIVQAMGLRARTASHELASISGEQKDHALRAMADAIETRCSDVLAANQADIDAGKSKGLSDAFLDRLRLDEGRVSAMAQGIRTIAELPEPVGVVLQRFDRPNGLVIERLSTPIGVAGVIYESRPNVTADAGALCLKSGNAVILRGGSDALQSSLAIHRSIEAGLADASVSKDAIQMVRNADRQAVGWMLAGLNGNIDVIIPRGGKGLVGRVQSEARVPVFAHLEGICHTLIDAEADPAMATEIAFNAKMRRTGICGATETLLVHRNFDSGHLVSLLQKLASAGCEIRGDEAIQALFPETSPANDTDWFTEYLAPILSVKMVANVEEAIRHIQQFGSGHTECIISENRETSEHFLQRVDSAIVMHNASTQFADGGEFGMGAEIGIATGKLHARGPVGVEQLTSFKYLVRGSGQTRPGG